MTIACAYCIPRELILVTAYSSFGVSRGAVYSSLQSLRRRGVLVLAYSFLVAGYSSSLRTLGNPLSCLYPLSLSVAAGYSSRCISRAACFSPGTNFLCAEASVEESYSQHIPCRCVFLTAAQCPRPQHFPCRDVPSSLRIPGCFSWILPLRRRVFLAVGFLVAGHFSSQLSLTSGTNPRMVPRRCQSFGFC
ncbi:hypothetical protein FB451DRAFT_494458 [Mycena latifolia]|nr:hypothetical protein FB451DRAFT_494458 [Mycena latifolia]